MKRAVIFMILSFVLSSGKAQSYYKELVKNRVVVNNPEEIITAFVKESEGRSSFKPEKYYTWYSAGHIYSTQGASGGKVLDGDYSSRYPNKNLKEKGFFSHGLKDGIWMSWNNNGSLKESITWNDGVKDGRFYEYNDEGKLLRSGIYKKGMLNGRLVSKLPEKDSVEVVYYKKGKLVEKKSRKTHFSLKKVVPSFLRKKPGLSSDSQSEKNN